MMEAFDFGVSVPQCQTRRGSHSRMLRRFLAHAQTDHPARHFRIRAGASSYSTPITLRDACGVQISRTHPDIGSSTTPWKDCSRWDATSLHFCTTTLTQSQSSRQPMVAMYSLHRLPSIPERV